jgi:hypothetical protein
MPGSYTVSIASQSSGAEDVAGKKQRGAGGVAECKSEILWNGNLAFSEYLFSAIFLTGIADH